MFIITLDLGLDLEDLDLTGLDLASIVLDLEVFMIRFSMAVALDFLTTEVLDSLITVALDLIVSDLALTVLGLDLSITVIMHFMLHCSTAVSIILALEMDS